MNRAWSTTAAWLLLGAVWATGRAALAGSDAQNQPRPDARHSQSRNPARPSARTGTGPVARPPGSEKGASAGTARAGGKGATGMSSNHPSDLVMPKLLEWIQAPYPAEALRAGIQGKVVLHLIIDEQGIVDQVQVVHPAGHGFDQAAASAARLFRFSPALYRGRPVRVRIAVVYPFLLKKTEPRQALQAGTARHRAGATSPTSAGPLSHRWARPPGRHGPAAGRKVHPRVRQSPGGTQSRASARPRISARSSIRGEVLERGTRDPVEDAECRFFRGGRLVASVFTDAGGRFALSGLSPGRYRVLVVAPAYRILRGHETLLVRESLSVRYYLERRERDIYQTVVTGRQEREEVSRHRVVLPEIQRIPGTQGDALRSIQNMPGVARASFGGGDLIVRGSAPGDTVVLIHGHPIPLLYHFGGLTSVINSDILSRIDFIPGNFSVRYGGAMGGVIEVETKRMKRRWHGYVDIDLWDAGLFLSGPLGKGSFAVTARRSYIDSVLGLVSSVGAQDISFATAPVYYDYQAMTDQPLWGGHLKVLLFGVDDRLKLLFDEPVDIAPTAGSAQMAILFHRALALWNRRWHDFKAEGSLSAGYSRVEAKLGSAIQMTFNAADMVWRAEISRRFLPRLEIAAGLDGNFSYMWADVLLPSLASTDEGGMAARQRTEASGSRHAFHQAFYVEGRWQPWQALRVIMGMRLDYGKMLSFSRASFDPRLNVIWSVTRKIDIKVGVGLFHQPPGLENLWPTVGGNPDVGYERALHVSAGSEWRPLAGLSLSATGFYKHMSRLIMNSYDLVLRNGSIQPESEANTGQGRVYGLELLVKKSLNGVCPKVAAITKCFGWISYTLMRSERREDPARVVRELPSGLSQDEWRLFDWDQTHILTIVATVFFRRHWEAGLRFRYATGNPTTPVLGGIYDADADSYVPIYGAVNSERIPAFHQLDLRVDKKWIFRTWMLRVYLDVQNVYNRKNPEFLMYNFNYQKKKYVPGLPIIPSLGIKGEF